MDTKKILVIDDDAEIRDIVQEFLTEQGYEVFLAANGAEGIQSATANRPDLILLDVELPDMLGFQVCEKIKEVSELRHTPVIMLTARAKEDDEVNGFKAGVDDYVTKPFKPGRLLARIQSAIGRTIEQLEANALTHLPGNLAVVQAISERIKRGENFSVLYVDLNNFKAFNDHYGFLHGDKAIKLSAEVLTQEFKKSHEKDGFLGHIGGDDFVGVVDTNEIDQLCQDIIKEFDKKIVDLYDEADRRRGMISSQDRKGNKVEFPIMGIAIAVVTNKLKSFQHPGEISFIAGDLKKWVKTKINSAYMIDRRS